MLWDPLKRSTALISARITVGLQSDPSAVKVHRLEKVQVKGIGL